MKNKKNNNIFIHMSYFNDTILLTVEHAYTHDEKKVDKIFRIVKI